MKKQALINRFYKRSGLLHRLLCLSCLLLAGCDDRAPVGEYEFVKPKSFMIDSGSPRPSIYYKGKKVCECVLMGSDQTYRDGILVFMSKIPEQDGGLDLYPQLFAIRGKGPPIVLSQRVFKQPVATYNYELWDLTAPTTNGLRTVFRDTENTNGVAVLVTNDISWSEIKNYVQEAETSDPIHTAPLGSYRLLPIEPLDKTNAAKETGIAQREDVPIERPQK